MTVCICGISFFFFLLFFKSVTWPQTHPQYPTQRVPQLVLVLLCPFSKPHWNEQLNPTDVSERPQLKPEKREGSHIYIGDPSRLITDEPPSFSARVCLSLRSSNPFTCHSCLIPGRENTGGGGHVRITMFETHKFHHITHWKKKKKIWSIQKVAGMFLGMPNLKIPP